MGVLNFCKFSGQSKYLSTKLWLVVIFGHRQKLSGDSCKKKNEARSLNLINRINKINYRCPPVFQLRKWSMQRDLSTQAEKILTRKIWFRRKLATKRVKIWKFSHLYYQRSSQKRNSTKDHRFSRLVCFFATSKTTICCSRKFVCDSKSEKSKTFANKKPYLKKLKKSLSK